jgi:hypothetical protein
MRRHGNWVPRKGMGLADVHVADCGAVHGAEGGVGGHCEWWWVVVGLIEGGYVWLWYELR